MTELLASSSTVNDENQQVPTKSYNNALSSEIASNDSSNVHSNLLHKRIVNMIETLRKTNDNSSTLLSLPPNTECKPQPITFGQLRQATISSLPEQITNDKSVSQLIKTGTEQKHHNSQTFSTNRADSNLSSTALESFAKHQTNKNPLQYSPSLEKLFEQQNAASQAKNDQEKRQKSSLTVDEILAMHYSKAKTSTYKEPDFSSSVYTNTTTTTTDFYIHPSAPRWISSQRNQYTPLDGLVLSEQNRIRPPPPSYLSIVANSHRATSTSISII